MAYTSDILLGRITKINGFDGTVTIRLEKSFLENIPQLESVFLEIEGRLVPFFISSSEYSGAGILKLAFEGYDSAEKVTEFTGCSVFLTEGIPTDEHVEHMNHLVGYKVLTGDNYLIGSIREVSLNPGQWLLTVISVSNKEILIPFHEDLIIDIDNNRKILIMEISEGLTEIN